LYHLITNKGPNKQHHDLGTNFDILIETPNWHSFTVTLGDVPQTTGWSQTHRRPGTKLIFHWIPNWWSKSATYRWCSNNGWSNKRTHLS
jgi:hypothetical protein